MDSASTLVVFASLAQPELAASAATMCNDAGDPDRVVAVSGIDAELVGRADVVIALSTGETFPILTARRSLQWSVSDARDLGDRVVEFLRAHRLGRAHAFSKITCELDRPTAAELHAEARRLGKPVAWVVREAWRLAREQMSRFGRG